MSRSIDQLTQEILALSVAERREVLQRVVRSLEPEEMRPLTEEEIAEFLRRERELDEGIVQGIPAEEVIREMRAKYAK